MDLYAGTGAVGIEALSRGARLVTFVESDPKAMHIIRKNLAACGMLNQADLRVGSTESFLRQAASRDNPYDVVFADPPYADEAALTLVLRGWELGVVADDGVMVIEQDARVLPPAANGSIQLLRRYEYGDTALLRYGPAPEKSAS